MPRSVLLRLLTAVSLIALACQPATLLADPIPVKDFARTPEFTTLKLSPDGRYIAFVAPNARHSVLGVLRTADKALVGRFQLDEDNHVADFWWVNDNRIVAELATQAGALDTPLRTGELVAVDADGSKPKYLIGYRGRSGGLGTRLNGTDSAEWGAATLIDPLINDPDNVLIAVRSFARWNDSAQIIYKLNVYTGSKTPVDASPFPGAVEFLADPSGAVRYAVAWNGKFGVKTSQRLPGIKEWRPYTPPGGDESTAAPLRFSRDGQSVYLKSGEFGPRSCLVQHVLVTGERRKLACDDSADLVSYVPAFDGSEEPIAALFEAGKPTVRVLEGGNPTAALLKSLMAAFPGKVVTPTSVTRDGKLALVLTYDDRTPGDYYLFNTETQKADYFAAVRQWLDPEQMPERRPIQLKARDGTVLRGFLTLPAGVAPKNLPLVVNPHGGPFDVRNHWRFDTEAALIASRGYAVLQINFRGSSGYGADFVEAGRKAWGTTMIDDITDATRWTVAQGYADASRICIYGGSYGGYAALMSAVREPELYRCVVGYAGVYDLKLLKSDTDTTDTSTGKSYFKYAIAGTDEEMKAQSPITYLDRLKASMLIVHGELDTRAPFSQAKALRSAMKAGNHPFEWMTRDGEYHGFFQEANVQAFDETLLAFLGKNIGQPAGATATSGAPR